MDIKSRVFGPIENRTVIDSEWEFIEPLEVSNKLSGSGYTGVKTGVFIPDSEAYSYALERSLNGSERDQKEFKDMLVEWFYSGGDWRRKNGKQ